MRACAHIAFVLFGVIACVSDAPNLTVDAAADGGCGPGETPCAGACFTIPDGSNRRVCALKCVGNGDCPSSKPCCAPIDGTNGACIENGLVPNQVCRCTRKSDCSSGCCAPSADANGNPISGPYVCRNNDGKPYACGMCSSGYCTTCAPTGSAICARFCFNDGECGPGTATCKSISDTSCGVGGACVASKGFCLPP